MHVDDGTGTNHNMRCCRQQAAIKSFQCKQVDSFFVTREFRFLRGVMRPACQSRQLLERAAGKHNKLYKFTFHVHQVSVGERKSSNRFIQKKSPGHVPANFGFACACRRVESSSPTCELAAQLVDGSETGIF